MTFNVFGGTLNPILYYYCKKLAIAIHVSHIFVTVSKPTIWKITLKIFRSRFLPFTSAFMQLYRRTPCKTYIFDVNSAVSVRLTATLVYNSRYPVSRR